MRHFLSTLDYPDKDLAVVTPPDPLLVGQASHVVHGAAHILGAAQHPDKRQRRSRQDIPAKEAQGASAS